MHQIKDSGTREEFSTGSVRDCPEGKGRYDLLPTRAMRRLAQHFEGGAKKYDARNWEKGQRLGRYLESAIRHAFNYLEGDRSEDHAIACAWNMMCLVETEERIKKGLLPKELDDLSGIPSAIEFTTEVKVVEPEEKANWRTFTSGVIKHGDEVKWFTREGKDWEPAIEMVGLKIENYKTEYKARRLVK